MDAYEATRIVFSRIQSLDPENASKIMGLLLIQDHGEKEMIRLAFGPEALVHSVVLKARKDLGLSSNTSSTPSTPSSPSPFLSNGSNSNPISISRQNSSSRMIGGGFNLPTPSSCSSSSWAPSAFSDLQTPDDLISPSSSSASYAAAAMNGIKNMVVGSSSSLLTTSSSPFYSNGSDLIDEYQLQDQLSFLNESSPNLIPKNADLFYPQPEPATSPNGNGDAILFPSYGATNWGASINGHPHRRSCSVTDIGLGSEDAASGVGGWKPCLYFARGYCKNGTSCRFFHGGPSDSGDATSIVGSPGKLDIVEQCQELLRSKTTSQHQRLAAVSQLMASTSFPYNAASASKCMNFLLQQQQNETQRAAAANLMMNEDVFKFGRSRLERNDFPATGGAGMVNPGSRQIYLTFPADSTFREEDVSNYFSNYGPVQDVRIPYQQKRMFGFVTFVYPETVKLILAKGNPHFVCDARVLVKPYKEKGKVPDKKQQQQAERGEFSACTTPTGLDSRDPYDLQLGSRMFYNAQDMLWRRKLEEQADLQQAIELQSRRLMGLQLLDVKKHHHHRNLSTGTPIPSPTYSPSLINQTLFPSSDRSSPEHPEVAENCGSPVTVISSAAASDQQLQQEVKASGNDNNGNGKEGSSNHEDCNFHESLEHNLPDSPFASPTESIGDHHSFFSSVSGESDRSNPISATSSSANNNLITSSLMPATSALDIASFKSCFFQMPRFSSGHGAIGM
ncbi:hypothetical protein HHK36_019754 [Tetracentron sinense]|uniref:Zinc finger CCCH domain-containing protein 53-like n=1 Tax=Tetracentron sinense TaxID=13715 RepID=A0A834YXX4_TETSI|nr:hypothetical protein HHK36_019754 [Tetracentron sinense]